MIHMRHSLIGLCIAAASAGVLAQGTDELKDHHPADAAAPVATQAQIPAVAPPSPGQAMGSGDMAAMDRQMQAMHEKMAAARTFQERQALMAEHMKTMQHGMRMMESMVQMMMDRMSMPQTSTPDTK